MSTAHAKTRKETAQTLRYLLDIHTPRKQALLQISKTLKAMDMPYSTRSIYRWCREFKIKTA